MITHPNGGDLVFTFGCICAVLASVALCVSDGYFPSRRASLIRMTVSAILFIAGIVTAVCARLAFDSSPAAASDWACDAFGSFTDLMTVLTPSVCVILVLCVIIFKRRSKVVISLICAALFVLASAMLTALFSRLTNDADTATDMYVRVFGFGCTLCPAAANLAASVKSLFANKS